MPTTTLSLGETVPLVANVAYALPSNASQVAWQSVTGGALTASLDGTNYVSLGASAANEVKTVVTNAKFIKTALTDAIAVARRA